MRKYLALLAVLLAGCGSSPEPEKKADAAPPPPPAVKDHSAVMPAEGLKGTEVVQNHILGRQELPGGTLANYEARGKKYQLFVVDVDDNQKAAFLLLDLRKTLKDPDYIDYMGGYFGNDGSQNIYVFAKLHYLAGVVGPGKAEADPIARTLASKLR
jgi:hypothetical protein